MRVIPYSGGFIEVSHYSVIPASRQPFDKSPMLIPQKKPTIPNFDVDLLAETFPNTAVLLEMDDFDPFDK